MPNFAEEPLLTTTWLKIPQVPRDTSMGHLNSNTYHRRSIERGRVSKSNCACRFGGALLAFEWSTWTECLPVTDVLYRFRDRSFCRLCSSFFASQVHRSNSSCTLLSLLWHFPMMNLIENVFVFNNEILCEKFYFGWSFELWRDLARLLSLRLLSFLQIVVIIIWKLSYRWIYTCVCVCVNIFNVK